MFTGIVSELGTLEAVERGADGVRLRVRAALAGELSEGGSVAVDGVCLTATGVDDGGFEADVMNATLSVTTLGDLSAGDRVALEPPVRAGDPLGGHLVQGHVDGVGVVEGTRDDGLALRVSIAAPAALRRYLVERGSVAVAGASLTISSLTEAGFEVSLIRETRERTMLGRSGAGERVNLEVDVVARYVERLVQGFAVERRPDGEHG